MNNNDCLSFYCIAMLHPEIYWRFLCFCCWETLATTRWGRVSEWNFIKRTKRFFSLSFNLLNTWFPSHPVAEFNPTRCVEEQIMLTVEKYFLFLQRSSTRRKSLSTARGEKNNARRSRKRGQKPTPEEKKETPTTGDVYKKQIIAIMTN